MSKVKHVCFDRILPADLRRPRRVVASSLGRARAIAPIGKTWINGSTLRIRFLGGTADQQKVVKQHAPQWTEFANLKFEFTGDPDAEIRVAFEDDGAWSYVGTDAKSIPLAQPTLNLGWLDEAVVLHEFGHAIGLAHEHQSPNGGIQWNEAVVIRDLGGPPNNWSPEIVRHNVLSKYQLDQIHGTDFDPQSIMLYSFPPEWTLDGFHSEPNLILSALDKQFIASAAMYPRSEPSLVEIPVQEPSLTAASIGAPGEEDRFKFKVRASGSYRIETDGPTDVVMKLFGPDSQTALIAEDDDSGNRYNARIDADLLPGEYYVQVRHYNSAGGTGDYGIRVVKF